jgi:DNA polymerase-3 subunit beta
MTKHDYLIDPAYIKAALVCASTEETRFYLKGVCFQKRDNIMRMISTDGHRLFVAVQTLDPEYNEIGPDFDAILPLADLKKALTGVTRKIEKISCGFNLNDAADRVFLASVNNVSMTPIEATYPDVTRLLPPDRAAESKEPQQFNATYVGDMAKIAKALGHYGNAVHIQHCGGSPAIISFAGRDDVMALLMPIRSEHTAQLGTIRAAQLLGAAPLSEQLTSGQAA